MNKFSVNDYVIRDVALAKYTSIGVGGVADYLIEADSLENIKQAVSWSRENRLIYKVIGRGTNIIVGGKGFRGLVIVNKTSGINFDLKKSRVIVESGYSLSKLILEAAAQNLGGMEELFGIPGSIGGALTVNAGTHGVSIGSFLQTASILTSDGKIAGCSAEYFGFNYRYSNLKALKVNNPPIILNAIFQLHKKKKDAIILEIAKSRSFREKSQPLGQKTSGSVFKNPSGSDTKTNIKEKSAGYLLDQSGAKSLSVGKAIVSKKHANWVINKGNADAEDVRKLIEKMGEAVKEKFSVTLEEEVEYFGQWNE